MPRVAPPADPSKPSQFCLERLGGVKAFATRNEIPVSTVWDWWNVGFFPRQWRGRAVAHIVIEDAASQNADIRPGDLVSPRAKA